MKLSILALDYDGTIAHHGKADPDVLSAIRDARTRGIVVVLVTGRILSDLRRVLAETDLFDAIVAENGAVLVFANGRKRVLGRAPSPEFLSALCEKQVEIAFGDCIVEADAGAAPKIIEAIREFQLPLMLVFNHGRVMVLPQGITKESGLRQTLNTMRLSLHNAIGIGDGENDHSLLDACEIGVAVSWGSEALKRTADHVLQGSGPKALAGYIREVSGARKLPPQRSDDRRILLGHNASGKVETSILGQSVLVAGDPRSGKSWITGLFAEHLLLEGYCLCVIDPEGDYSSLVSLPNVVVFDDDEPPRPRDIARALQHPDTSIVISLSTLGHEEKVAYVQALLPTFADLRRRIGLPHWIVVDEAHYFLNQPNVDHWMDFELAAYVLVTYRPSLIHPALLKATRTIIATPWTNADEISELAKLCGAGDADVLWGNVLGGLGIDEAAVVPRDASDGGVPQRFTIAPRLTSHVRHRTKYVGVPVPKGRAFYFTCHGQTFGPPAETLKEFVDLLGRIPVEALEGHARRGDFSRWLTKVFGDQPLTEAVREVEETSRRGEVANLVEALSLPIRERYELSG